MENGKFRTFSKKNESKLKGFQIANEGKRGSENFSLGESELNFSSNIDDKFYGSLTAAIVREGGEDKIELEEQVKSKKERVYTDTEIKEDFISNLIGIYDIYDNENLIRQAPISFKY